MFSKKKKINEKESSGKQSSTVNVLVNTTNNGIRSRITTFSSRQYSSESHQSTSNIRLNNIASSSQIGISDWPRSSLQGNTDATLLPLARTNVPYRSAFSPNTFASYPSRSNVSPVQNNASSISPRSLPNVATALPSTFNQSSPINTVPTYPLIGPKRGRALIINNITFADKGQEREGAQKDGQDLKKLLKKIGFEIDYYVNKKAKEMETLVENFSQKSFKSHDISLVVIMSHGHNKNASGAAVAGGYTEISGTDHGTILIDEIVKHFVNDQSHKTLNGKPKIFIFQCCRGEDDLIRSDAIPIKQGPRKYSDVLLAFSTLPGYLSNRNPLTGTWYIQSICEVFDQHYKNHHIEDMLKIVDESLTQKHPRYQQTSTYEARGFKRCYLYPKPQ